MQGGYIANPEASKHDPPAKDPVHLTVYLTVLYSFWCQHWRSYHYDVAPVALAVLAGRAFALVIVHFHHSLYIEVEGRQRAC